VLILAASLSALAAVGLVALAGRRVARTTALPFGPFLALGLHAALLVGAAG
jgi:leader peptidase (prepilin peptidase)/N-methyltransferase